MSKLTDEQINQIWSDAHNDTSTMSLIHVLARAIEAAATEPLLQRIAHLEATASANYGRGHADAHSMLSERIAELERQLKEVRKDAERYQWIRKQHWSENILGVVVRPKDQTKLGSMLPSMELLDDTIDHMSSEGTAMQKGQS